MLVCLRWSIYHLKWREGIILRRLWNKVLCDHQRWKSNCLEYVDLVLCNYENCNQRELYFSYVSNPVPPSNPLLQEWHSNLILRGPRIWTWVYSRGISVEHHWFLPDISGDNGFTRLLHWKYGEERLCLRWSRFYFFIVVILQ